MTLAERLALAAFHKMDPEAAHGLALKALSTPFAPRPGVTTSPRLKTSVAGLDLPNPVGLAAGFDKNAVAVSPLMQSGFGFLEVGAATPRPQPGNPKPRLFRLSEDQGVINRFGFNNDGVETIADRLSMRPSGIPVGLNLGANKDSDDKAADFAKVLAVAGAHVDFATVNVSSPNTEKLRDLQGKDALAALLAQVMDAKVALPKALPVFLKIAPDLTDAELSEVAAVARNAGVDAIIATNTTLDRSSLSSPHKGEAGGLSGRPLFAKSTRVLARLSQELGEDMPLIGVGGISSGADALAKIKAGASAVQLYSALTYQGLSLVGDIVREIDKAVSDAGANSVSDLVGTEVERWL